jgi:hypothetical protein
MSTAVGYTALSRVLAAVQADLADLTCKLASAPMTPSAESLIADFTEADFDGYLAKAVSDTGSIYLDGAGNVVWRATPVSWQPTGATTPNVIHGWWIEGTVGGAGARFVAGQAIDPPVSMGGPLDFIEVAPVIPLGQPK